MKRLGFILGAIVLMALSGGSNSVVSGSATSADALKAALAPDKCAEYSANIAKAEQEIDSLYDEIESLEEDILAGKNVEWAEGQIRRLRAEIRRLQGLIQKWQRYIDQNC